MELYGFSGKMGTGKNYIAEKVFSPLLPKKNTIVMAFADHFKVDACAKLRLDYDKVFGEKDDETREKLQKMGTEEGRAKYGKNIWIDVMDTWIRVHQERGIERVIITDVRFLNEVEYVKSKGGKVFRIHAPKRNLERLSREAMGDAERIDALKKHVSETELDSYDDFDYIILNDPEYNAEEQLDIYLSAHT